LASSAFRVSEIALSSPLEASIARPAAKRHHLRATRDLERRKTTIFRGRTARQGVVDDSKSLLINAAGCRYYEG
jgi:hypothetical protein